MLFVRNYMKPDAMRKEMHMARAYLSESSSGAAYDSFVEQFSADTSQYEQIQDDVKNQMKKRKEDQLREQEAKKVCVFLC